MLTYMKDFFENKSSIFPDEFVTHNENKEKAKLEPHDAGVQVCISHILIIKLSYYSKVF